MKFVVFEEFVLRNRLFTCFWISANKQDVHSHSVFSNSMKAGHKTSKGISKTKQRKNRRNTSGKRQAAKETELNEKFLKNLSTHQLSDDQVNVLSKGSQIYPNACD